MSFATLAITMGIEAVAVIALAPFVCVARGWLVFFSLIVNIITQPLFALWLENISYGQDHKWPLFFVTGEVAVIAIEALFYYVLLHKQKKSLNVCILISVWANVLSLTIGLFIPL